jgi:SAM-dependent methyltransferase
LLFVATILVGSFLLFLVQPMVARLALPLLGGAPNVWNSAMLVYQALLLGGYAYAHALSGFSVRRQAMVHLALLVLGGLTLPIALAELPPPVPGLEALWVPALLALTIGPVFFLVSAQAPLMQRWFAADGDAGDPYWLYAASNIGSFAGLLSYPLLLEPLLSLRSQSLVWSGGYALLVLLVAATAAVRWHSASPAAAQPDVKAAHEPIGAKRILLWLALAAVPSGLMLSTTTHLTTDIFAMPLLWVIPLGLYLLSYVPAFSANRTIAYAIARPAPLVLALTGSLAMVSNGNANMSGATAAVLMLFVVAVSLHARLYDSRPEPGRLTLFYLVMSAGGAMGGLFTALVAPLLFDWVWEHPLLVLAAAALLPRFPLYKWMDRIGLSEKYQLAATTGFVMLAYLFGWLMRDHVWSGDVMPVLLLTIAITLCALAVLGRRWAFVFVLGVLMMVRGGIETLATSLQDARSRSYFGVYTVRDLPDQQMRMLAHGTTMHGRQFTDAERELLPTSYYGPSSGVGLALAAAPVDAKIGIVGLGAGTLACYRQPGQEYHFFEIDPAILDYSLDRTFTFVPKCAPDAEMHIGDARLKLAQMPTAGFDVLVIDAFSSDAIPLHLLTQEAIDTYAGALAPDGVLLFHISNRYIDLAPVLSAAAEERGWEIALRDDRPAEDEGRSASFWVATAPQESALAELIEGDDEHPWARLPQTGHLPWTDNYASILPFIKWENMFSSR